MRIGVSLFVLVLGTCAGLGEAAAMVGPETIIGQTGAETCASQAARALSTHTASRSGTLECSEALRNNGLTASERPSIYFNRGLIEEVAGANDLAMTDFNAALNLDPQLVEAYVNRGTLYHSMGRHAEAIADFTKALAFNPDKQAIIYYDRALAYEDKGDLKEAYLDYLSASRLAPNWAEPKEQLTRFTVTSRQPMG